MRPAANAMEIFKRLPKTNCRACNETTCLAFASTVYLGSKPLSLCPYVEGGKEVSLEGGKGFSEAQRDEKVEKLKARVAALDLAGVAPRVGGVYENGRLGLRVMGKSIWVDDGGNLSSDIHTNRWIYYTVLSYLLVCQGKALTGNWVPFRELAGAREKNGLFVQRTEHPFKELADGQPDLFEALMDLFNGEPVEKQFQADISLKLSPLPLVPLLVCYWRPEEGMDSDLHLFFDASADVNAGEEVVYTVAAGIVTMFEKIASRHWYINGKT